MVYITCFTLKEKNIHAVFLLYLFVGIWLLQYSFSFFADFLAVFFERVSYCHKMLRLSCRGPKSCSVWTSMNCKGKKAYSSAWQKVTTSNCEFNVWLIYLNFKIRYQSTKTWSIGEALYELNTKYWLDYHHQRLSFKCCSYQF